MDKDSSIQLLQWYRSKGFSLIPLRPRSKTPAVRWKEFQLTEKGLLHYVSIGANWAIRLDEHMHVLDFDDLRKYEEFMGKYGHVFTNAVVVRTGRGFHVWFKPVKPTKSFTRDGIEIKGIGSLIVVPPSIHPSGVEYEFATV